MLRTISRACVAALFAVVAIAPASSARAQIGTIFSDQPPRPPGSIPGRRGEPPPPADDEEEDVPELPQGRVLPAPTRPGQQGYAIPGPVQSQPLAPVPGTTVAPPGARPGALPPQGGQQANIPPAGPAVPGSRVPQAPATLQPGDEVVTEPPAQKIINKKASFSGLDKITGRIINFDEEIGETVQFGALRVKTDACYTRPATEAANTDAFVEVDEITLKGEVKRIFSGWMFAASPGLHAVEHPIYDIWLSECKDPETTVVSAAPDQPKPPVTPPPAAQQKRNPAAKQAAPRPQPQPGGLFGGFRQ